MTTKAVYIHIPFCEHKCFYCDFNTYLLKGQPVDQYIDALHTEMRLTVQQHPPQSIDSIFVGGGTPTALTPAQMERFLAIVQECFPNRSEQIEFTVEANPGTTDEEKLRVMRDGGVNRISFGAQTFQDHLLQKIGRIHDVKTIFDSIESARKQGFQNLSIDLMFGLPNQTLSDMEQSIKDALSLQLPHYSFYSLKIEEHTPFHVLYEKDQLPLPDEDTELAMYERIIEQMVAHGYEHYEISNFAKKGFASRHNLTYWHNEEYYGIGAGAHGYVGRVRHVNVKGVQAYIEATRHGLPRLEQYEVSQEEAMEDFMMVGLRVLEGVQRDRFKQQFGIELEEVFATQLTDCIRKGLLEETASGYRLTSKGLLFGNDVFAAFLRS